MHVSSQEGSSNWLKGVLLLLTYFFVAAGRRMCKLRDIHTFAVYVFTLSISDRVLVSF